MPVSAKFVKILAHVKARTAPALMRRFMEYCLLRRWSGMIAVAAQTAYAGSLLEESTGKNPLCNDVLPDWGEVLCDRAVAADGPSSFAWARQVGDPKIYTDILEILRNIFKV